MALTTRAIVLDDDGDVGAAVAEVLGDAGIEAEVFSNPAEALERACRAPEIDVAIVDYLMPVLTGTEFIRSMRCAHAEVPVVLLTGLAMAPGELGGAAAYLKKPVNLEHLLTVVREVASGARAGR